MRTRFDQQLEKLHVELIKMGSLCEQAITLASSSLEVQEENTLHKVAALESEVDAKEREIEDICMRLLLQQQPVARDLRVISAALKLISDLERIGDQAADISDLTPYIVNSSIASKVQIHDMAKATIDMVTKSIDAFVKNDLELAEKVIESDDIVDDLFNKIREELIQEIQGKNNDPRAAIDILMAAKYFERIGDHAVNVAEWVQYSITGVHRNEVKGLVYLVEDDENIRELVTYTLNSQGIETESFERPSKFWKAMQQEIPSLFLLDIMLPEEDGLSILKKIKNTSQTKKLPVIMLTAKGSEYDTVLGLDSGADDYIAKPFRMMELISRVRAALRRSDPKEQERVKEYQFGKIYVCPSRHIVSVDGKEISLTLKEFELLCVLLSEQETVFSRSKLLDRIWGYEFDGESRTVDVVRTLRQKLGDAGDCIKTVRGVGYKIGGKAS